MSARPKSPKSSPRPTYTIGFLDSATRALARLTVGDRKLALQIKEKIQALATDPRPEGCVKLHGTNQWRVRVRDWRIIYEIRDDVLVITVIDLAHRREVYR